MLKKTSEARPLSAKVVNVNNNSQTDAYSCDYINDCNTYSTTEIDTGKTWVNGKHIYSTTFEVSTFNSSVNHNISNIDEIINAIPKVKKTSGNFITDNYYLSNNDYACAIASTTAYTLFVSATPSKAYVVIEYTKSS